MQNARNATTTHCATDQGASEGRKPQAEDSHGYTPRENHISVSPGFADAAHVSSSAAMPGASSHSLFSRYVSVFLIAALCRN